MPQFLISVLTFSRQHGLLFYGRICYKRAAPAGIDLKFAKSSTAAEAEIFLFSYYKSSSPQAIPQFLISHFSFLFLPAAWLAFYRRICYNVLIFFFRHCENGAATQNPNHKGVSDDTTARESYSEETADLSAAFRTRSGAYLRVSRTAQ